jgi:hypothetical protein
MTLYQFNLYMQEIANIMRIFNGQPPMKKPAELNDLAKRYGITGPAS